MCRALNALAGDPGLNGAAMEGRPCLARVAGASGAPPSIMSAHHILSFARDLSGGGVERALLRLAGAWAKTRRVTLVLGRAQGPLRAELAPQVELVDLGVSGIVPLARALPGVVRGMRPDLLFCPGSDYTSSAAWTRLRLGRAAPPILAKQSNAVRRGDHGAITDRAHRAWLALHGRFLDHLVAMTPALAEEAGRAAGMAGRVTVIPNPPAAAKAGTTLPPLPERFILGVGRLVPQKRWDRLIAALPTFPGIALVLAGEGPERAALTEQAARLGVGDRLHLLGHVADPLPLMAHAAVLALTSDFEGAPGVLSEALSVGTPVVATWSSPAVPEIVHDPALGHVLERDDAAGLTAALGHWLDPATPRPPPQPRPGADSADRYLSLFDALVAGRR
jgi:glycosyltransferase involved in cell wall biosynthesis